MGHGPLLRGGFLDDWVTRLREENGSPVVGVLLRGSHARGAATVYSDVDLDVLVDGPPYAVRPAYLADGGDRLVHVSVAVRDVRSWLARLDEPAEWAFGLPVASPAELLWAAPEWRARIDRPVLRQPAGEPRLEELIATLGKVATARLAGDETGVRLAADDLARLCPSVLRLANPPVTVASRRIALDVALGLPVVPPTYRADMLACLGLRPGTPAEVYAAAGRLVAGTVALIRPYADELAAVAGADLSAALRDGRLDRYVDQLTGAPAPLAAAEARDGAQATDAAAQVTGGAAQAIDGAAQTIDGAMAIAGAAGAVVAHGESGTGGTAVAAGCDEVRSGWDGPTPPRPRTEQSGTVPVPDVTEAGPAAAPVPASGRPSALDPQIAARLRRTADGLVPAVVRQYDSGEVLMLAWMDDEALHRTLTTGRATYWSRSRREYWVKGATSGHHQYVRSVALDCDGDTVLVTVDQVGAACHTGERTCFFDELPVTGSLDAPDGPVTA